MAAKNPKGKSRPIENPYEEFTAGSYTRRVLKHYQALDKALANQYARVFCATKSPNTFDQWELGDAYIRDIPGALEYYQRELAAAAA